MRILFTGGSSFTGYWFVKTLHDAGHDLCCTFTRPCAEMYGVEVRGRRVAQVAKFARPEWNCRFGDDRFIAIIRELRPDVLCHHAADVSNYKSSDFDFHGALASNTFRIREVLQALNDAECHRVVLTGSVFEAGEGKGSDGLPAFSPYGLSKSLTAETFVFFCREQQMSLGKFVIPNPFGPWEDPRFTAYLMRCWRTGDKATVRTPDYVRDNIHASLLGAAYVDFMTQLPSQPGFNKLSPSGYTGTQWEFAELFAREISQRLGWPCGLDFFQQTDFSEPLARVNTDYVDGRSLGWDEAAAWDDLAEYYWHQ